MGQPDGIDVIPSSTLDATLKTATSNAIARKSTRGDQVPYVRYNPNSGAKADIADGPRWANCGQYEDLPRRSNVLPYESSVRLHLPHCAFSDWRVHLRYEAYSFRAW